MRDLKEEGGVERGRDRERIRNGGGGGGGGGDTYTVNKPLRSIVLSNKRIGFTSIKCFRSRSPI